MNDKPLILAHRGARKYAPENTIPAFKKAIELGVDGVEFDLMSTLDGVPVVVHDDNLHRLTGKHIHVHKMTYNDLKQLDVGSYFSPYFSSEKIPTLNEALEALVSHQISPLKMIDIELKSQPMQHKDFIPRVAETLKQLYNPPHITVSSFSPGLIYKFMKKAPTISTSLLLRPRAFFFLHAIFFASILKVSGLNPQISMLKRNLVRYARKRGLEVVTWTANTPEQIEKAIENEVDAIVTDEPVLALEMIQEMT